MITTFFTLPNYDNWGVYLYVAVDKYYTDEILDRLESIGCKMSTLVKAEKSLRAGQLNTGFTYSNYRLKKTVMVIALTTSAALFYNSIMHEQFHLLRHICQALELDPYGEDSAYCAGEIAQELFPTIKQLFCDHCRQSVINNFKFKIKQYFK